MPPIVAGQIFNTLAEFKTHLRAWAVEEGFTPAILDSDAKRVRVGCRTAKDCPFRIRCNFDPEKNRAKVGVVKAVHTCHDDVDNSSVIRGEVTKLKFLIDAVPQLMMVHQGTTTKEIIDSVKNRYGQVISVRQAQKVKATLLAQASDQLGKDLYSRMRQKLGEDATDEEMRRGKRLRDEDIDPALRDETDYEDYPEYEMDDEENGNDGDYFEGDGPQYGEVIDSVSKLETGVDKILEQAPQPSAAELRAEAAALFQQASIKMKEATELHMQASRLFSQASEMENQTIG